MLSALRWFMFPVAVMLILIVFSVPIESVAAAGTLDQEQTLIDGGYGLYTSPAVNFVGQTFRAGLTGSLTEVDLAIACFIPTQASCPALAPVTVEIHSGGPTGALLGSSSLDVSAFPTTKLQAPTAFVAFIFSSPSVVAGSLYAIVITTSNGVSPSPEYTVGASEVNPYPRGMAWEFGTQWNSVTASDLAFKTYVAPAAIPEYPLGLPLLAIFMVIAYGLIRRRASPTI